MQRGTVYAGSLDYHVYALDAQTGQERWRFPTGQQVHARPVAVGDLVIVGSYDEKVYGLNSQTGAKVWEYAAGGPVLAPLAAADGIVYASSWNNDRLHALDANTGTVRWTAPLKK